MKTKAIIITQAQFDLIKGFISRIAGMSLTAMVDTQFPMAVNAARFLEEELQKIEE